MSSPASPLLLSPGLTMTTPVQRMIDWCRLHTKLQNFINVGQINMEPMKSILENTLQTLYAKRMPWKHSRVLMGGNNPQLWPNFFMSNQGTQDYDHAGATCFSLINSTTPGGQLPAGGAGVDLNPGTYQNGNAQVAYGTWNGGPYSYAANGISWQNYGVVLNPANGQITVQFLDPHPFLSSSVGTTPILIAGVMNPAFNSTFVWNNLQQLSNYVNTYSLLSIPDMYHIVIQGTNRQYGAISAISATGGVTTLTIPAGVTMLPGFQMTITGATLNPSLNGLTVTLLSAATPPAPGDLTGTVSPVTTVTFTTPANVTITNGVETGTLYAASSGAPGIFNFGWLEQSNLIDINNPSFPLPINPVDAVHRIVPEYTSTGDAISVSCEQDYGNGVVRFRISEPVSTYPFAFAVVYQTRPQVFSSPRDIIIWPDNLMFVVREVVLAYAMRFAYGIDAKETAAQMNFANSAVMTALASEDREANEQQMIPSLPIMR